jgi:osmotically-inducible protein OsmY
VKSDSDLQHDIQDALARERDPGADELEVRVLEGVVTLTGKVRSDSEKWRADVAVRRIPGVKELRNETMVFAPTSDKEPSADIARGWFP